MNDNPYEEYLLTLQVDKQQNEKDFQKAWEEHNVDKMWWCVYNTCLNIAKSIYRSRGVIVPNEKLLDITTDATYYCMEFILGKNKKHPEGVHPKKLSSYCYFRVLKFIQDPKEVWYEKNVTQMPQDNYKDIEMEIKDA